MRLPDLDPDTFDLHYRLQPDAWREAVLEVCESHALPVRDVHAFGEGCNLVASVGEVVVKIFPPFHRHQWESERRVLGHVQGRLSFRVPELRAEGERPDGWTYVVIGRVPGVTLEEVWSSIPRGQRAEILRTVGRWMAEVHAVPVGELRTLPPDWGEFLERQVSGCRDRQARLGMPAWLVESVEGFVAEALPLFPRPPDPVVLTGEYTPFNLMVEASAGAWRLAGMIDFGDAMVGFHEYDLLGPIVFLAGGDPNQVQAFFEGYGLERSTAELRRRLMVLLLLHRYSHLDAQVRIAGWRKVGSLEGLERLVFGHG